ncbi:MAG: insulinase family protein [Parachlamydiales bacterium]|nr:insulinase family protein [Parachlamydiales bacterium]
MRKQIKARTIAMCLLLSFAINGWCETPSSTQGYKVIEDEAKIQIYTPSYSQRKTLKIQLDNGLQAYIVSDPLLDKSGAALAVHTGAWSDPKDRPGMAHFLEHMLFMGTEKYPKEAEYSRYISENGGKMNAYTMGDRTVYFFSINSQNFDGALDRFAQFFIHPLFNPSGVDREMHAVDQEHAKNIQNDDWRIYFIQKELGNPQHPNSGFSTGNLETLNRISQKELIDWYNTHYSSNIMTLVVYSTEPLDKLVQEVVNDFKNVPNHNLSPLRVDTPLLSKNNDANLVAIAPFKQMNRLMLSWELPIQYYYDTPLASYLLGEKDKDSLYAELIRQGLAEDLRSGVERMGLDQMIFELDIRLTQEGVKKYNQVLALTFSAIEMYQQQPIPDYLYNEMRQMALLQYQYPSRGDVTNTVADDASNILSDGLADYPEKTRLPKAYDEQAVKKILDSLTPETCQIFLVTDSKNAPFKMDRTEKWMGTEYGIQPIAASELQRWDLGKYEACFKFPPPNPFIPNDVKLVGSPNLVASTPASSNQSLIPTTQMLLQQQGAMVYYAADDRYYTPEVAFDLKLTSQEITPGNPKNAVLLDLYALSIDDLFTDLGFMGDMAGLQFNIRPIEWGVDIKILGYSEKSSLFLQKLLQTMKQFDLKEQRFNILVEDLKRVYQNGIFATPLEQAKELLESALSKSAVSRSEKLQAIQQIKFKDLLTISKQISSNNSYVRALFYGNLLKNQAQDIAKMTLKTWQTGSTAKNAPPSPKALRIDSKKGPYVITQSIKPQGNAAILMIEADCFDFKKRAAQQILSKGMQEPFFSELRTKQQTGYIVSNMDQEAENELLLIQFAQSKSYEASDLLARFELFNEQFLGKLQTKTIPKERFEIIRQAFITTYQTASKNLAEMASLLSSLAFDYNAEFDRVQKRLEGFNNLSYDEFLTFANGYLGKDNHRRLAIFTNGTSDETFRLTPTTVDQIRKDNEYLSKEQALCH